MEREGKIRSRAAQMDNLNGGENRELVSLKAGKASETAGAFQIHIRKTRITRAQTLLPPNNCT